MADTTCAVDGCSKPRKGPRHCSMHATRLARHGDVNALRPNAKGRTVQSGQQYIVLTGQQGHPLAKGGALFEHRAVLYAKIGPDSTGCHWCSKPLHWHPQSGQTPLHVDHLDANRQNNDPANLVPSCQTCNNSRRVPYKRRWTHCPNGHEYNTPDNQVDDYPRRRCRICRRIIQQRYEARARPSAGLALRRMP